jgi:hypothetical protein
MTYHAGIFLPMTQHKRNNYQQKLSLCKKFQNFSAFVYFNLLANIQHARNNFANDSACGKYFLPMCQLAGNFFSEGSAIAKFPKICHSDEAECMLTKIYRMLSVHTMAECAVNIFCRFIVTSNTDKIFLIYKEILSGIIAQSKMRKGFLIYEEMRKYFPIYEEAVSHT